MSLLLKDLLAMAKNRLESASCLDPKLDAELLFCHMVEKNKSWLFLHYGNQVNDKTCEEFFQLIDIRASGVPLQHITGKQEFMGLPFKVNKKVLIPRQDTEMLVEKALEFVRENKQQIKNYNILDICSGSGAIAVSMAFYLKKEKYKFSVTASDISKEAIDVAKENAQINGVEKKITFVEGDLFKPFPKNKKGRGKRQYHIITGNPPYIPTGVIPTLIREVKNHEPAIALDGGFDGLDFYHKIINEAHLYIKEKGVLLLEIGHDQGEDIKSIAAGTKKYKDVEIITDYAGNDRLAVINPM